LLVARAYACSARSARGEPGRQRQAGEGGESRMRLRWKGEKGIAIPGRGFVFTDRTGLKKQRNATHPHPLARCRELAGERGGLGEGMTQHADRHRGGDDAAYFYCSQIHHLPPAGRAGGVGYLQRCRQTKVGSARPALAARREYRAGRTSRCGARLRWIGQDLRGLGLGQECLQGHEGGMGIGARPDRRGQSRLVDSVYTSTILSSCYLFSPGRMGGMLEGIPVRPEGMYVACGVEDGMGGWERKWDGRDEA
jgi:hypothetical protein